MTYSKHYTEYRTDRALRIESRGGDGEIIFETISYDKKRQKNFRYCITDKAVLYVMTTDRDFLITKYFCSAKRVSRLYQTTGQNAPWWLLNEARKNDNYNY